MLLTICLLDKVCTQVIKDKTLGNENSVVTQFKSGSFKVDLINGAATGDTTLFLSFEKFSV
ncbi:hypothetical protein LC593_21910 [Nostoc sp. CHAB 5844]|nr:hypothetical protein [Nostoc sp. CHAB 5844]